MLLVGGYVVVVHTQVAVGAVEVRIGAVGEARTEAAVGVLKREKFAGTCSWC